MQQRMLRQQLLSSLGRVLALVDAIVGVCWCGCGRVLPILHIREAIKLFASGFSEFSVVAV